jgi:hypothetical protein
MSGSREQSTVCLLDELATPAAVAIAACHKYLGPVGLTDLCSGIAAWLLIHVHAKGECLYVSTLPPGVIKFVKC